MIQTKSGSIGHTGDWPWITRAARYSTSVSQHLCVHTKEGVPGLGFIWLFLNESYYMYIMRIKCEFRFKSVKGKTCETGSLEYVVLYLNISVRWVLKKSHPMDKCSNKVPTAG